MKKVVITGLGMVTPLGSDPNNVQDKVQTGVSAARSTPFTAKTLHCPSYAPLRYWDAESHFPDNKALRFMNRDAQLAVIAAQRAMQDAGIESDLTYPAHHIALFGSAGMASLGVDDIAHILRYAADSQGHLNLERFGQVALKRIRPVLSFRILTNMPLCFISIFQNIKGPNAVYGPWEGHGAQAIAAGIHAIECGSVPCALVGGCDVKTLELSFISLQQLGVFSSWREHGSGCVPAEGAVFLVLEEQEAAAARGRTGYARIRDFKLCSCSGRWPSTDHLVKALTDLKLHGVTCLVSACDGNPDLDDIEKESMARVNIDAQTTTKPKTSAGNLFAAAAPLQLACAALATHQHSTVLANCLGFGTEQGAFVLEAI